MAPADELADVLEKILHLYRPAIGKVIDKPYFSKIDILLKGLNMYSSQLSLWRKKDLIVPLKRGLYCFSDGKEKLLPELVSALLYEPSYLSMEFALSYYGFIPEMVF